MKIWIHLDDTQQGPFGLDELPVDRMDADTPVWHPGLNDWVPARAVPEIAAMLAAPGSTRTSHRQACSTECRTEQTEATTYITPTLIISILTFNLVGIVPLVLGFSVRSYNRKRQYAAAASASECTAWWLMVTIVVSLMIPFTLLL